MRTTHYIKSLPLASAAFILGFTVCVAPLQSRAQSTTGNNTPQTQTSSTATSPDQAKQTSAGKFVQNLGDNAIHIIADKSLTQEQHTQKYSALLHDAFDIPTIGRFVLGRAWNTASPQQQQEYLKLFEALVIKIYGDRLNFYSGEGFEVKAVRSENDKELIVSSAITHTSGQPPTSVDWRVRLENGKLSIVDVSVAGVSQSLTQRQEYAAIIESNNGDINGLLDKMRERLNQPATNGTSS